MPDINMNSLENAILEVLDDEGTTVPDVSVILKTAELVWDDTAVQVTTSNTKMIFDLISYEMQDYIGYDADESEEEDEDEDDEEDSDDEEDI